MKRTWCKGSRKPITADILISGGRVSDVPCHVCGRMLQPVLKNPYRPTVRSHTPAK